MTSSDLVNADYCIYILALLFDQFAFSVLNSFLFRITHSKKKMISLLIPFLNFFSLDLAAFSPLRNVNYQNP